MAFFRPGVGEKNMQAGQRSVGNHLLQHLDRIVLNDAQVGKLSRLDLPQQGANAGRVDLDTDEIFVRQGFGNVRRGAAHAEADLDNGRRFALEYFSGVERGSS